MKSEKIGLGLSFEEKLRLSLSVELEQDGGSPSHFLDLLARAVEERIWEKLDDVADFADLVNRPKPSGLDSSKENVLTLIQLEHRDEKSSKKIRDRMAAMRKFVRAALQTEPLPAHRPVKHNKRYDGNTLNDRGNSKDYTLGRLKRDSPAIFESYLDGGFPSVRQAGIAAGIIKDVKRIQVLPVPEKIAAKCKERLTPEQIQELIYLLGGSNP